ncbi:7373_t:CDS:1 [Paraglomus occultum]|uniref:7373_t:CDS:1 n=1 Tax=Paraglomus occultum TaxID=144539 RepID=A0A9N9FFV1_9GLOM|nr:7373_t:CDS:1 [Paraglomus occultum]
MNDFNIKEITFNKDPTMESKHKAWLSEPPAGVILGMTIEELLAPSKRKKSRLTPPRPQQSYILFRKNYGALHSSMDFKTISSISKNEWKSAAPVVREFFNMLSEIAKRRHHIKYPTYKYKPQKGRRQKIPVEAVVKSNPNKAAEFNPGLSTSITVDNIYDSLSTFAVNNQPVENFRNDTITMTTSTEVDTFTSPEDDDGLSFFNFDLYMTDG